MTSVPTVAVAIRFTRIRAEKAFVVVGQAIVAVASIERLRSPISIGIESGCGAATDGLSAGYSRQTGMGTIGAASGAGLAVGAVAPGIELAVGALGKAVVGAVASGASGIA